MMRSKAYWALPAIFAAAAAMSTMAANADVPAILSQAEGVLIADAVQVLPASLLSRNEPVTITDSVQVVRSEMLNDPEAVSVTDSVQLKPAALLTVTEAISVSDAVTFPDTTPPIISVPATIVVEATSPNGAPVIYTVSATDARSGAVPVTCSPLSGSTFPLGSTTVNCSASDPAGNVGSASFNVVVQDTTPPGILASGVTVGNGNAYTAGAWTNQSVRVSFSCTDSGSGVDSTSVSAPVTVSAEGANQSVNGSCRDQSSNMASTSFGPINIDKTRPVITASATTADGNPYVAGTWTTQNVTVSFACTDDRSGVAAVTGPITLSSQGANQTASGDCTDVAGNAAIRATFAGINIDRTPPVTGFTAQPGPLNGRQLATVTGHVVVSPGTLAFDATCFDSFGVNAVLTVTDPLAGAGSVKYGAVQIVAGRPLPNPPLDHTVSGSSATIPFVTTGAYVLNYASVDAVGNQSATQTRWIFVNKLLGVSCVTTPVPVSSLPPAGTVSVTASLQIGPYNLPFAFSISYPSRD